MSKKKYPDNAPIPEDIPEPTPIPLEQLRDKRKEKKSSMEEISEVLEIDRGTYSRYEQGLSPIPSDKLVKLSKCLGVSCDYILGLDTHLNKGNKEFMEYSGLNEQSIENLRTLKLLDIMIVQAHKIHLGLGGNQLTALETVYSSVLDLLLSDIDLFTEFVTSFIRYSDNNFIYPVYKDNDTWVPLNEFGLSTDLSKPDDCVSFKINEHNIKAIHKNTLDIVLNRYVDLYKKRKKRKIPTLETPDKSTIS